MVKITLYTRRGCHLCDDAKRVIESARRRAAFDYEELDIDADARLRELYNDDIPVIAIDGRPVFRYRLAEADLLQELAARA